MTASGWTGVLSQNKSLRDKKCSKNINTWLVSPSTHRERGKVGGVVLLYTEAFWLPFVQHIDSCNFHIQPPSFNSSKLILKLCTCCLPSRKKAFCSLITTKKTFQFKNLHPARQVLPKAALFHSTLVKESSIEVAQAGVCGPCQRLIWHHLQQRALIPLFSCLRPLPVQCFPKYSSHIPPPTQSPRATHQSMGCWQLPLAYSSPGVPCLRNPPSLQSSLGAHELPLPLPSVSKINQEAENFS